MAQAMSNDMKDKTSNNFIIVGHSAGADAVILAANMVDYQHIHSIALLDPSMNYQERKEGPIIDLTDTANQIDDYVIPLFLADSLKDEVDAVIEGAIEPPDYIDFEHERLAVSDQVFNDARSKLGWP